MASGGLCLMSHSVEKCLPSTVSHLQCLTNIHPRFILLDLLDLGGVLRLVGQAHDGPLVVAGLPDVLVAHHVVPQRLQTLQVAVTDQAEEEGLDCR